jgi:uncharacterized membrane protein YdjX (TVP38/TMEM64 family)
MSAGQNEHVADDGTEGADPAHGAPVAAEREEDGPAPVPARGRLIASGVLGALWISLPPLAGFYILYDLANIAEFLRQDPAHGFWAFVAVFAVSAGLGLLPTYSQAFLGGWVFGMKMGLVGSILGFTGGAAIGYLFSRMVAGESVDRWIDRHRKGRVIRDTLARGSLLRTLGVVTLIRLPPSSPFALTNLALGATRVPFWLVMLATPLGMLPRTAVVCFLAAAAVSSGATDIMKVYEETPRWAFVGSIVVSAAAIALIGWMAERALTQLVAPTGEDKEQQP